MPTTVGIVAKKPPLDAPLIMTKAIIGANVVDTGHRASMLRALSVKASKSALSDPSLSQRKPDTILPMAEEKLKPATRPAPALDDRPIEWLHSGRKKGGTRRGNVPTAPAMNKTTKRKSRKRRLQGQHQDRGVSATQEKQQ